MPHLRLTIAPTPGGFSRLRSCAALASCTGTLILGTQLAWAAAGDFEDACDKLPIGSIVTKDVENSFTRPLHIGLNTFEIEHAKCEVLITTQRSIFSIRYLRIEPFSDLKHRLAELVNQREQIWGQPSEVNDQDSDVISSAFWQISTTRTHLLMVSVFDNKILISDISNENKLSHMMPDKKSNPSISIVR